MTVPRHLLAFLLLAAPCASAATYYVSTAGNDLWPGTIDSAFATIPRAVTAAAAGDTIYVRGGTHGYAATITLGKSGTAGSRYYLMSYPGERALLDFSSMAVGSSNRGIRVSGSWWHVKGLDVYRAGDNGMHVSGSNNIIEFCTFFENYDTGLQLSNGASNNQVINCDSYFNADIGQGNADGFAPKLDVGTGNVFYGCRAWQNSDDGYDGYLRPSDGVVTTYENCWCFQNGYLKNGTASVGNGNGFKMGGSDGADLRHQVVMKNCMAFDNRVKGFDQNNNRGSMTLYNCTAYRNGTNYSIAGPLAAGETLRVVNCDVLGSYGTLGASAIQATNSWMSPFVVTAGDFVTTDTAGVRGPRKADGSLPDVPFMRLAAASDLIDGGTDVGLAYNGPAPDLGAFETEGPVAVQEPSEEPTAFRLGQNYPNPFNPITHVVYVIDRRLRAELSVFDVLGRHVTTLVNEVKDPGSYSVQWDAGAMPAGVYYCRLSSGTATSVRSMILTK